MPGIFYSANEVRGYPFDDQATRLDDSSMRLPDGLLADISLSIPNSFGNRVFCSAMSKTIGGSAFVFSATDPARTVLAIGSVGPAFVPRRAIPLTPMQPFVKGTFVPGEQIANQPDVNLRFTNPNQSMLCARTVFPLPISSQSDFGEFYGTEVFNRIVTLIAAGDMAVRIENRTLGGATKKALVFSLTESGSGTASNLERYAGGTPRPESRTCGDPQPLESLAGVRPDCCGRVFIELRGCAQPIPISNFCGVALDCPHEADSLCTDGPTYELPEDDCIEEGIPDPLDPPKNGPDIPPWYNNWRIIV